MELHFRFHAADCVFSFSCDGGVLWAAIPKDLFGPSDCSPFLFGNYLVDTTNIQAGCPNPSPCGLIFGVQISA